MTAPVPALHATASSSLYREDRLGSYSEQLTFKYTSGTNSAPLGTETIGASSIQSLSRSFTSNSG